MDRHSTSQVNRRSSLLAALGFVSFVGCGPRQADILLLNGRVYTLAWDDPAPDGKPAANAPYGPDGWHPDAEAVASPRQTPPMDQTAGTPTQKPWR
jgi:hypothetical protein